MAAPPIPASSAPPTSPASSAPSSLSALPASSIHMAPTSGGLPSSARQTDPLPVQPVPSTSALTLDEPAESSSVNAIAPSKQEVGQDSSIIKEDEDAKLLASLASDLSNGLANTSSEAESQRLLTALANQAVSSSPAKSEPFLDAPGSAPSETKGAISAIAEDTSGPIQAYAKLEFPGFSYYIQTLDCTIGRRPAHMRTPALEEGGQQNITGAKKLKDDVDVDLGMLKSISRLHVRIFYQDLPRAHSHHLGVPDVFGQHHSGTEGAGTSEEGDAENAQSQGRFVLQVLGRNGAFVDDVLVGRDAIVPLGKRTKIQIAERVFYFVLPPAAPLVQAYNSDGELDSEESYGETDEDEASGSLGSTASEGESSGLSSMGKVDSEEEEEGGMNADVKRRPRLVLKKNPVPPARGGKGKGKHQGKTIWSGKGNALTKQHKGIEEEDVDQEMEDSEDDQRKGGKGIKKSKLAKAAKEARVRKATTEAGISNRKRKRGEAGDQEHEAALKVGTPIGVEALDLKAKKKKKKVAESGGSPSPTTGKGKGKGGGKAHIAAAAIAAKAKADEQKGTAAPYATPNGSLPPAASPAAGTTPSAMTKSGTTTATTAARPPLQRVPVQSANPASSVALSGAAQPAAVGSRPPAPMIRPGGGTVSVPSAGVHSAGASAGTFAASQVGPAAGHLPSQRPPVSVPQPLGVALGSSAPRPLPGPSTGAAPSSTLPTTFPPSAAAFAHLTNHIPQQGAAPPLPPAGPGIKPELSNMDLIKNALSNAISTSRGGKLTLQEIYEDITSKYEWYRTNNRSNGRDWHSSIRHAVGSSRDMVRIPRKANEQGKGIFYALNSSEAARLYRIEMGNSAAMPVPVLSQTIPTSASVSPAPPSATPPARPPTPSVSLQSARPSPPVQSQGRVTIVIGKAPAEALSQMASAPKAAITQSIEALFGGPPIVHHEGKLYLSPLVFGHMSASEISDIGGKGAQQALAILQSHLVNHLQSKMNAGRGGAPTPRPTPRPPVPASTRPPVAQQLPQGTTGARPPAPQAMARPRPPHPPPPSMSNGAPRPGPPAANNPAQRPAAAPTYTTQSPRPPPAAMNTGRPVSNGLQPQPPPRPAGAPTPNRPSPVPGSVTPLSQSGSLPATSNQPPRPIPPPIQQSVPLPRPPVLTTSPPLVGPTGAGGAPKAQASLAPSPATTSSTDSPSVARPAPLRPPSDPAAAAAVAAAAAAAAAPSSSAPPSSNAMLSAMQALASHPDAAGLMTLLSGGKMESGTKLTPGQLDLLQRAGRIAAEQQKAQQQRRDQTQGGTASASTNVPSPSLDKASASSGTPSNATPTKSPPAPSTPLAE